MSTGSPDTPMSRLDGPEPTLWQSMVTGWNRFWFTPGDPTLLGLIRLCCGLLAVYTIVSYTWDLDEFFGKDAWLSHELRRKGIDESPLVLGPLGWPAPAGYETLQSLKLNETQYHQIETYIQAEKKIPPPEVLAELGLTEDQREKFDYIGKYMAKWKEVPPLPFPKNKQEADYIDEFRVFWNVDPRLSYANGNPHWSVWLHVTDPDAMMTVHCIFITVTVLFAVGFCTRLTSVLAWFAAMCYVHRSPTTLFGVDTMMLILMIYLMIGPSGAAVSVDRLLARWWRRRRAGGNGIVRPDEGRPRPTVGANFALRLLQVHVCFIYAAAGLAKLQGSQWWTGTAVWGTLANPEFAPMQSSFYMWFLHTMAYNIAWLHMFLAAGTYFTLFFEICYPFMIWGKRTRWLMLGMAVMLHGVIGMIMGLKSFALMMLVMNMAFLPPQTVHWMLGLFRGQTSDRPASGTPVPHVTGKRPAVVASPHSVGSVRSQIKPT